VRERLRLATSDDAAQIAAIYAPFVAATHVSFEEVPPTADEMRARLSRAAGTWPWVVCERDGNIAGYAYASAHRTRPAYRYSVDVSAYVHEAHRGTGVGRRAYGALLRLLQAQGYRNAFAGVTLPNDASVALHRALGFVEIGRYRNVGFKAGAWHDTMWLQRPLGTYPSPPPEPQPLRALAADVVAAALAMP